MKKIYTLVLLTLSAAWSYGQQVQNIPAQVAQEFRASAEESAPSLRGGDEPFWYSDFSDAALWNAETVTGNYNWEISTSTTGWFYNGGVASNSGGEYAFIWNGDPTGTEVLLQGEANLTTAEAIDVSTIESAVLEFQMYGARFTDSLKVQVSNNGTDFVTIGNQQDIGQLTAGGGSVTANPLLRSYNMTLNVEGQDDLWIRFNFGTAASGIAYGWFIDDVTIVIPEDFDLAIADVYTGDIINDFEYTITPLEQAHPITLGGNITNLGGLEAVNARIAFEVLLDGDATPVYTGETAPVNVIQGQTEQIWLLTDYTPSATGTYTVNYTAVQDGEDAIPDDNTNTKEFRIDDIYWANDDYNNLSSDFDGALGDVTTGDEWQIGTSFTVFEPGTRFEAASVSFASGTQGDTEIGIALFELGDDINFITSSEYVISNEDVFGSGFTAIQMEDQIELEVGTTYLVAIQHLPGEGTVVVDCSTFDNDFSTLIFGAYGVGGVVDWFSFDDVSPAIRISTSDIISVDEVDEKNLTIGQNYPNPMSGITTIPFSLDQATDLVFEIADMTGRVIYTEDLGTVRSGSNNLELNDLSLSAGLYNYSFISPDFRVTKTLSSN